MFKLRILFRFFEKKNLHGSVAVRNQEITAVDQVERYTITL
jgi:hypothetical protein